MQILIENGHIFGEIKEYTLDQFNVFLETIGELNELRNTNQEGIEEKSKPKGLTLEEAASKGLI